MKIVLLTLTCLLSQARSLESFPDFPMTLSRGNYLIHAIITDLGNTKKFTIEESITSSQYILGKISISSSSIDPVDVHYGSSGEDERLVLQNNECDVFLYKNRWNKQIPGVTKSLTNNILLVGPSLIYRLKNRPLTWIMGNKSEEIRGVSMASASTWISNGKLKLVYYFKDNYNLEGGLSQPSRIKIFGTDASSAIKEKIIIDYYLIDRIDGNVNQLVNPRPGFGCPFTFVGEKDDHHQNLFELTRDSIHFISVDKVEGPVKSTTRNEVYASEVLQLLYLKQSDQTTNSELIYDYNLGIVYTLRNQKGCFITPMKLDAPGIMKKFAFSFRVENLLDIHGGYKYIGKINFENRMGLKAETWEAVDDNVTTSSGTYDKVISNFFATESSYQDSPYRLIPLGRTYYAYNIDSTGKYALKETRTTEFYDFGQEIANEEFEARFRIEDCYPEKVNQKVLLLQFDCKDAYEDCVNAAKKNYYTLRNKLRMALVGTGVICSSRVGGIEIVLDSNRVYAYVTFLNIPDVTNVFEYQNPRLAKDFFKDLPYTTAYNSKDCLKKNVNYSGKPFEALVFRVSDGRCYMVDDIKTMIEDKESGSETITYYFPLKNMYRYAKQAPLDRIGHEIKIRRLTLNVFNGNSMVKYIASQVDEVKDMDSESRQLYVFQNKASKLPKDGTTIVAPNIKNIADCYSACSHLSDGDCEAFSFCQSSDEIECILSTSIYANVTDKRVPADGCEIYRKTRLNDYQKIAHRAYKNPISIATDHDAYDCADLCSQSDECSSFQICDKGSCTVGGYYTDSSTTFNKNCEIYFPKVSQKYTHTNKKIVTESYHTELNLSFDQCAALCYEMGANMDCLSFNYCPKGAALSQCSLSKYSVKDSSTKTIDSDVCTNYQLKSEKSSGQRKKNQENNGQQLTANSTSVGGAFGIIIIFIAVGLVVGLIGPFAFNKTKNLIDDKTTFGRGALKWNRHVDGEELQTAI